MIANWDRICVFLMHWFQIHAFPTAIAIAILIREHPDEWSGSEHSMNHPKIGSIWISNKAYGIKVTTVMGVWYPNAIERRIIREAVDWRINAYIKNRLDLALRPTLLSRRTQ